MNASAVPDGVDLRTLVSELGLSLADVADLVEGLPEAVVHALLEEMTDSGRALPVDPIATAEAVEMSFLERPHLRYLSDRISKAVADVEAGQDRRIIVQMPPRAGKTTLGSKLTVGWTMGRHPTWPIALTSHDGGLATSWGREIRKWAETGKLGDGVALAKDAGAASSWETTEGGKLLSISIRESFTGRGAKVLIIDDPHKDFVDAHSKTMRDNVWGWWLSVAQTRLEPPSLVIVTMCLTGETPVLMADGTEKPLRDVRVGDQVATYEDGGLTSSTVRNWKSQGRDRIRTVRMESGREVRGNDRHPFLTVNEDGTETWVRLGSLKAGMKVRSHTAPTAEQSVLTASAASQPSPRACVCGTTGELAGLPDTGRRATPPSTDERSDFEVGTVSRPRTTTSSSERRTSVARFVEEPSTKSPGRSTGPTSSASTTTMTPERCEDCFATTATSSSAEAAAPRFSELPLRTWSTGTDRILEIVESGEAEVFDVQIDRTENFIANGLTVHNTRWHEDDFVGRLLSKDHEGAPEDWEVIRFPAIAEDEDVLGRAPGEPILSPLIQETPEQALVRWAAVRRSVGEYVWSAMYQQRPSPSKGSIFDMDKLRFWTRDPDKVTPDGRVVLLPEDLALGRWLDSWDTAFKATTTSDFVVGQRWVRRGANRYLIAQRRDRWTFTDTVAQLEAWAKPDDPVGSPYGHLVHQRLVEEAANGPAIISTLKDKVSGLKPIKATIGKEARARAITPEIESGNVLLPLPSEAGYSWVTELVSEMRNFPNDAHDDQVDALTQALTELRDTGKGAVTPAEGRIDRHLARAASSGRSRIMRSNGR